MSDFSGRPLVAGTVRGVRSFNVDPLGRLTAIHRDHVWVPGENTARCHLTPMSAFAHNLPTPFAWSHGHIMLTSSASPSAAGSASTHTGADPIDHPTTRKDTHDIASCECGFYAFLEGSRYASGDVEGVIEAWGDTTLGSKGFRASKARVLALCVKQPPGMSRARWRFDWLPRKISDAGEWGPLAAVLGFGLLLFGTIAAIFAHVMFAGVPVLGAYILYAGFRSIDYEYPSVSNVAPPFEDATTNVLRRNYPDVEFFTSRAAMLKKYPVDKVELPNPDTDPDFWTRPIT